VAPFAAVKNKNHLPSLQGVLKKISGIAARCDVLLIEGSGGLMVPLNGDFFVVDLIQALECEVIVVARNQLGTINHTLLSISALETVGLSGKIKVILMDQMRKLDASGASNFAMLSRLKPEVPLFSVPFLGRNPNKISTLRKNCKKIKNTLARLP
jgi:dethiobiotin synthetase